MPEIRNAAVGKFYRPVKTPVTIRVDADVLAWLKRQGRGYQTRINQLLRKANGRRPKVSRSIGQRLARPQPQTPELPSGCGESGATVRAELLAAAPRMVYMQGHSLGHRAGPLAA
jgi:hypothetical protein